MRGLDVALQNPMKALVSGRIQAGRHNIEGGLLPPA
jgi:hypothetical protein